jgi:hypothetical protein
MGKENAKVQRSMASEPFVKGEQIFGICLFPRIFFHVATETRNYSMKAGGNERHRGAVERFSNLIPLPG